MARKKKVAEDEAASGPVESVDIPFQWVTVKSAFDKKPVACKGLFSEFAEWLLEGKHELAKGKEKPKLRTPAFSPCTLLPGETELVTAAILQCTALAIDFDATEAQAVCKGTLGEAKVQVDRAQVKIDLPALVNAVTSSNYSAILYETASSTPEFPRVRLVVPFALPIAAELLPNALASFLETLGFSQWVDIPTSTRIAGIHFVPMAEPGTIFYLFQPGIPFQPHLDCAPLDVPAPTGLDEARHKMHEEWDKAGVQVFDFKDLQSDGWMRRFPIDWKALDIEKLFREGLGVEVEKRSRVHKRTGKKWRCQCPLYHEHSKINTALDAVIFTEEDGYPGFHCPHQHLISLRHLVLGTEDGSPAVIDEDMLMQYAEKWVSPMAKEAKARKVATPEVWYYRHASAPGQRMANVQLLSGRILKWAVKLDRKGNVKERKLIKDQYNVDKIFQHDDVFTDLQYDLLKQAPVWRGYSIPATSLETVMSDLRSYIVENYNGICINNLSLLEAFLAEANRRPFHPVFDYLSGLAWDGISRIAMVPQKVHAVPNPLVPEYFRCFFVGCVARALHNPGPNSQNGAKFDTALILQSDHQGTKKTTFFQTLVPQEDWFGSEAVGDLERDALLIVHRHWIHEMGEIDALHRKHEAEKLKNFMSQTQDTFRLPYGRATGTFPRRFALGGSTNRTEFLEDDTGARRWHIVMMEDTEIDVDWIEENRDQIWAEAVALYHQGVTWYLDRTMSRIHEENSALHMNVDAGLVSAISKYFASMDDNAQKFFMMEDISAFLRDEIREEFGRSSQVKVGMAIQKVNAMRHVQGLSGFTKSRNKLGWYYHLDTVGQSPSIA